MLCDHLHLVYNYALHYCIQYIQTGYSALAVVCDVVPASNLRKNLENLRNFVFTILAFPLAMVSILNCIGQHKIVYNYSLTFSSLLLSLSLWL